MNDLRIIYMGTPEFAVRPLEKLLDGGFNVVGVVTNIDKPSGRGRKINESPVKKFAISKGLKVLQPERFRDDKFLLELSQLNADIQIVVAFKMLPKEVWAMPKIGTFNLHTSLLPDYRGAAPINYAIINGEKRTGVTTFMLNEDIDSGAILYQKEVLIGDSMTAGELHDLLMEEGADLVIKTLDAIKSGGINPINQDELLDGREPKIAPKIFKDDMKIDWEKDIDSIYNKIRGLSPYPTAWTEIRKGDDVATLKIYEVEKIYSSHSHKYGKILTDDKTYIDISVNGGFIRLKDIHLSGKKRMPIGDFLRGFSIGCCQL